MHHLQQAPAPATTVKSSNGELKEQIQQTIEAATQAALEGGRSGAIGRPVTVPVPPVPPGGAFTIHSDGLFGPEGIPTQIVDISVAFFLMCAFIVVGWPIARAFGKRLERRADVPAVAAGTSEQLQRIEQAVDAMAIEIERISESQRFMARLQSAQAPDRAALPAERP